MYCFILWSQKKYQYGEIICVETILWYSPEGNLTGIFKIYELENDYFNSHTLYPPGAIKLQDDAI